MAQQCAALKNLDLLGTLVGPCAEFSTGLFRIHSTCGDCASGWSWVVLCQVKEIVDLSFESVLLAGVVATMEFFIMKCPNEGETNKTECLFYVLSLALLLIVNQDPHMSYSHLVVTLQYQGTVIQCGTVLIGAMV